MKTIKILYLFHFVSLVGTPDTISLIFKNEQEKFAITAHIPGWHEDLKNVIALAHANKNDELKAQAIHLMRSYRKFAALLSPS